MGKTADLTAVQKAIIDTLKQEGKTQKEISERKGCSQCCIKAPQWDVCEKEKVWQKTLHNQKR